MRSRQYLQNFKAFAAAAFFTAMTVGVLDGQAYAQRGKGHGKNGGGPPGHQRQMGHPQRGGNGQKARGGGNPQRQMQRAGGNNGRGQQQQQMRIQPMRVRQPQIRAQQPQMRVRNVPAQQNRAPQWANRGQQMMKAQRQQAQRQQHQQIQRQRQQQVQRRQQQVNVWNARQQMMQRQAVRNQQSRRQQVNRQHVIRQQRDAEHHQARQRQTQWANRPVQRARARQKQVYTPPVQIAPGYAWTGRQWGQSIAAANRYRRDQKHAWKAAQKEQRRFEKEQRRYARDLFRNRNYVYFGNYSNTYYVDNDYGYDYPSWKEQLLRRVISGFLGGDGGHYSTYSSYYPNTYERQVYYTEDVPRYYSSPIFVGYSQGYAYDPEYYYSDYGYDEDNGFDLGGMIGQLPIQELLSSFAGDGFVSELLGGLLVQGYDEGFLAGQAARDYGYDDDYYDNPYVFEGGFCDPYSVSLGENRELLGEGYAIGYRDALDGSVDYDPFSDGNVDLVSALLSGVLGRV